MKYFLETHKHAPELNSVLVYNNSLSLLARIPANGCATLKCVRQKIFAKPEQFQRGVRIKIEYNNPVFKHLNSQMQGIISEYKQLQKGIAIMKNKALKPDSMLIGYPVDIDKSYIIRISFYYCY